MEWLCSDGTSVRLRGVVEGTGPLAKRLRSQLELLPIGRAARVPVRAEPGGKDELDTGNPYHVDAWVRMWLRFVPDVTLVRAPALTPLPLPPAEDEPGTVY